MATKADWQDATGKAWANNVGLTDRAFSGLTQIMLERLANCPGDNILDIGCGGGELSVALAQARPKAKIVGVDISPDLVDFARRRAAISPHAEFEIADAARWERDGFAPDLLVSRHGVMFFDDPAGAFGHLREMAAPGARLFFSCFRDPASNIWASEAARLLELPPPEDSYAPGPFALAEEERTRSLLARAGWREIVVEPVDFGFVTGSGEDPVDDALNFFSRIGPAARAFEGMDDAKRADALQRLRRWLAGRRTGQLVALPAAAWIVTARKPD